LQGLGGQNTFLGGKGFCIYYTFETNFSGHNKLRWGHSPNASRVATGLPPRPTTAAPASHHKVNSKMKASFTKPLISPAQHWLGNARLFSKKKNFSGIFCWATFLIRR